MLRKQHFDMIAEEVRSENYRNFAKQRNDELKHKYDEIRRMKSS